MACVAIGTAIASAAASSLIGSALTKKPKATTAPPPVVTPPTEMPDPLAQKAVQRRKAAKMYEGQLTAANTVLTGNSDTLG